MILKNKKILYISPRFFNYENKIKNELENLGAEVDFFDDRPSNDFITKVFIRLKLKSLIKKKINEYYSNIYAFILNKNYDYVFAVSPETLDYEKLSNIKRIQSNSKFILYMWDSFKNKNSFNTIDLFDKVLSFDTNDCKKYNLNFLPLFYTKDYNKEKKSTNAIYDLSFIATAHSDRYKLSTEIKEIVKKNNLIVYYYFYLPSILMYLMRKLFIKKYKYGNISEFSFKPLSQDKIKDIFDKSNVILDINHPDQIGLTMRTFECLGSGKKLITINKDVQNYDFYNSKNILIIDREDINIDISFFEEEYENLTNELYRKYSLNNWLKNIFNEEGVN